MLARLVLLFLLTPAVELALLIQVDSVIGFWPTVGLIVATGVVGSYLARREGLTTWRALNRRLQSGELPGRELVDGVIILVAGALLVTPGVLTDGIGFIGLLPPTRALVRRYLVKRFQRKIKNGTMKVQFGVFGGPGFGSGGSGPNERRAPNESPREQDSSGQWQGEREDNPGHADGSMPSGNGASQTR